MKRIWVDGCFDMFHFGHANALRQARSYGDYVCAGIHSSEEILRHKSLPVMSSEERIEVLKGCKWVDEVVPFVPYVTEVDIVKQYGCSLVLHGNDIVTDQDGQDAYHKIKKEGKFGTFTRTRGISTTDIVGRMLLKESHVMTNDIDESLIELFRGDQRPKKGKVVFTDGSFDLFHAGHSKALENAKKEGDYLIVGLHSDLIVKNYTNSPSILNEKERLLVLLSNKHVDEVVLSPYVLDNDFIESNKIDVIVPSFDTKDLSRLEKVKDAVKESSSVNEFSYLSVKGIVDRIIKNYQTYEKKVYG